MSAASRQNEIERLRARGHEFARAGRIADALAAFSELIALDPSDAPAYNELGMLTAQRGDFAQASQHLRRAIELAPDLFHPHFNLGTIGLMTGDATEAEPHLRRALELAPNAPDAILQYGAVLAKLNRTEDEAELYRNFERDHPEDAKDSRFLFLVANLQFRLGKAEAASALIERVLETRPNDATALDTLGRMTASLGRYREAIAHFDAAIAIQPLASTLVRRATVLPVIQPSRDDMLNARRRFESEVDQLLAGSDARVSLNDPSSQVGCPSFYLAYHGLDDRSIQEKLARLYLKSCPSMAWTAPHCTRERIKRDRIRVGFVSTHLHGHTIGKLNYGLIAHLDRSKFEVSVFHLGHRDAFAERVLAAADRVGNVSEASSISAIRQEIASHELDVLYFADVGMHVLTYCLAFARLAPVQCVTWGHPDTTGIPTLDYFISSEHLELPGSEVQYTETLIKLPRLNTYFYRPAESSTPFDRARYNLDVDWPLVVCPQALFKFHPDFDPAIGAILRGVPTARLLLIEGKYPTWGKLLLERFARSIPDVVDRIIFLPRQTLPEFLALLAHADVNLDTPVFGGGNTSYEAFAVGSPIVTLPSNFLRGRITYAQYMQMGVTDLIARDMDDYVRIALRLLQDVEWRAVMRDKIRTAASKLYEDADAVRALEDFFERAVAGSIPSRTLDSPPST